MNKLIICCGGDNLGKTSLIKGLCEHYDYKNVTIRHCDKPPKDLSPAESLDFQFKCFYSEANLIRHIFEKHNKYCYHDNVIIFDRFYLGEFVYGQMFRNMTSEILKKKILFFEEHFLNYDNVYLITLTADPDFFLSKEDGKSFSQNIEQKTKELNLFREACEVSRIKEKLLIKVDNNSQFRTKEEILNETIDFLEHKRTILSY
ncbi:MAG: hypothetical protein WC554_11945 [Clostridia bacterium]